MKSHRQTTICKESKLLVVLLVSLFALVLLSSSSFATIYFFDDYAIASGIASLKSLNEGQPVLDPEDRYLFKIGDICYLQKNLKVSFNGTFYFNGNYCKELRMYSNTSVRIAGVAYFDDIKVTSEKRGTGKPIIINRSNYYETRPHIYTKHPAKYIRMTNSEFSYLGFYDGLPGSSWGVSLWELDGGHIINSSFHHNYFGVYTFETRNLIIEDSVVHSNVEYGMDFHDFSDNFIIRNNTVYDNGNHGIIFSVFCINNTISNNYVFNHTKNAFVKGIIQEYGVHGIMLDRNSDKNTITNNVLENNREAIRLSTSNYNLIAHNIVLNDLEEGLYLDKSSFNKIDQNIFLNTTSYGLYSYYSNNNTFDKNYFQEGTYFKYLDNGNSRVMTSRSTFLEPKITELSLNPIDKLNSNQDSDNSNLDSDNLDSDLNASISNSDSDLNKFINIKILLITNILSIVLTITLMEFILSYRLRK